MNSSDLFSLVARWFSARRRADSVHCQQFAQSQRGRKVPRHLTVPRTDEREAVGGDPWGRIADRKRNSDHGCFPWFGCYLLRPEIADSIQGGKAHPVPRARVSCEAITAAGAVTEYSMLKLGNLPLQTTQTRGQL